MVKKDSEKFSVGYSLYFTKKQSEELEKRAKREELSFSAYIRRTLFPPIKEE